ncbi:MAG: hypothetical protein ABIN91_18045 [Mucilaginibacter sp.]|uniref:hypothetical protein n=1 Tax=Mucilaginibacter sp. TaxID=1882438 RepID=UPI003264A196
MPGHAVTGGSGTSFTTPTTGSATFGTTTGTVTFTIENMGTYTWTLPNYFMGFGTTPTTGVLAFSTVPSTLITSGSADVQQFINHAFSVSFEGVKPGTYSMNFAGSFIKLPTIELTGAGGTEVVTVTSESFTITSTDLGTVKGSAKGTFDGKMVNMATNALVKVSGTFDVSLQ